MNCKAACGSFGQPGNKCTFVCQKCGIPCHGKFINSLKESVGKEAFNCLCMQKQKSKQNQLQEKEIQELKMHQKNFEEEYLKERQLKEKQMINEQLFKAKKQQTIMYTQKYIEPSSGYSSQYHQDYYYSNQGKRIRI